MKYFFLNEQIQKKLAFTCSKQQWTHQNDAWNLFKFRNKVTGVYLLALNRFHTLL